MTGFQELALGGKAWFDREDNVTVYPYVFGRNHGHKSHLGRLSGKKPSLPLESSGWFGQVTSCWSGVAVKGNYLMKISASMLLCHKMWRCVCLPVLPRRPG